MSIIASRKFCPISLLYCCIQAATAQHHEQTSPFVEDAPEAKEIAIFHSGALISPSKSGVICKVKVGIDASGCGVSACL